MQCSPPKNKKRMLIETSLHPKLVRYRGKGELPTPTAEECFFFFFFTFEKLAEKNSGIAFFVG